MVHLDGVERAVLGAVAALHADGRVNPEALGLWLRLAVVFLGAHDPDALRRADARADAAGRAPVLAGHVVLDQKRHEAEVFRDLEFLFGILDGDKALHGSLVLFAFWQVARAEVTARISPVALEKMLERDAHARQNALAKHDASYRSSSPNTMSIEPRMITTSATLCPRTIVDSAPMLTNDGA